MSRKAKQRWAFAQGSPYDQEDAALVGGELEKIATANRIDDVRTLSPKMVLDAVESDPDHPLRKFFQWDVDKAARAHWLAQAGRLIRSVRIITVSVRPRGKLQPAYTSAEYTPRGGGPPVRRHIAIDDAMAHDPIFLSALSRQAKAVIDALVRLEHLTLRKPAPEPYKSWIRKVREATDEMQAAGAARAAE